MGGPTEQDKKIGFFEVRKFFGKVAFNPKISLDFEGNEEEDEDVTLGLDLPVYFLQNKDGQFVGGLRAGWRSDTKEVSVALFVGSALDLFK